MKKLIFLLAIVLLFSCKKQSCYECTIKYTTTTSGVYASGKSDSYSVKVNQCDMTDAEIANFIKESTTTATVNAGGVTATTRSTCKCTK